MKQLKVLLFGLLICACQPSTTSPTSLEASTTLVPSTPISTSPSNTTTAPTLPPSPAPTSTSHDIAPTAIDAQPLTITILYNNIAYDPRLETAWGFSALIERGEHRILFDTGGDGSVLMKNFSALGMDPSLIEHVFLSHIHGDHTGGLTALLNTGIQPTLYIPPSFPASFKNTYEQKTTLVEVSPGYSIHEGILSTGEMGSSIPEQALILRTIKGMVIITGCAHPGIVQLVEQSISLTQDPVYLVMGGFHLGQTSRNRIAAIVEGFKQMGVEKVAPSHCTGDLAIEMFREAYGENFLQSGAGHVIIIQP